jgi:hypothetical protein
MGALTGSIIITIFVCALLIYISHQFVKKVLNETRAALELIEALTTEMITLKGFMEKMHKTMHLIKSIDPMFNKYRVMNEALKNETTIENTHDIADSEKIDLEIEKYYEQLFEQDNQMHYLGSEGE